MSTAPLILRLTAPNVYDISANRVFKMTRMQKMNVIAEISLVVILAQCRYTEIAQRIFKYCDIQYTSLTLDKKTEQFDI